MAESEYFDARTLNRPASGQDRVCPVASCKAKLQQRQIGKRSQLICPEHSIKIHPNTFGYEDPLRNIRFERDYFRRAILYNKLKAETHRLGYENSEDALTWNVFSALARRKQLSALSRSLFKVDTNDEPELYLWGLRVCLDGPVPENQFDALCAAREVFECNITRMNTEPDIMLYAPNRFLFLVEAKFTSPNTIAKWDAIDVPREKPKSPAGILERYSVDRLPSGSLHAPPNGAPFFSQLYRNLVFAIHMADQLKVQWGLVNLTTKQAYDKMADDLATFANAILPPAGQQRFVRYTWEKLFRDHVEGKDDLQELATYLRFKSSNRDKVFEI